MKGRSNWLSLGSQQWLIRSSLGHAGCSGIDPGIERPQLCHCLPVRSKEMVAKVSEDWATRSVRPGRSGRPLCGVACAEYSCTVEHYAAEFP